MTATERVGAVLSGKWTLEALLGEGGMGAVYRARHDNGSRVAIKILHSRLAGDEALVARFRREARVANRVDHPGVARVFDDGVTDDGAPFLVTELVDGPTLEEERVEAGGRLPIDEVVAIGLEVLDVLAAAHERGVVHRDLKPRNLARDRDGRIKLLDFGVARATGLDMADWWQPTADSYFAAVPKTRILTALTEAVSAEVATSVAGMKKAELVKSAENHMRSSRWLPELMRQK